MKDLPVTDYSPFDRQEILLYLFHPRPESGSGKAGPGYEELSIPVGGGIHIGGRLYVVDPASPCLLFFHGNGEIVEDYHDLGDIYTRLGLNFMPVDYRGYGKSTGVPTVSAMMRDCHAIYEYACELLSAPARSGPLVVMGRSLGSAPAIESASPSGPSLHALLSRTESTMCSAGRAHGSHGRARAPRSRSARAWIEV